MEDGACLFRAVADQIFGDEEMHQNVRKYCMEYIVSVSECVGVSEIAVTPREEAY